MKAIETSIKIKIPAEISVSLNGRTVNVKGPRGALSRNFSHTPIEFTMAGARTLNATIYFGARKHVACLRTIASHIENMIKGVTLGYAYKMRAAYAHFPINVSIADGGKVLQIRNYLGEKIVRKISMLPGCIVAITDQKDEIIISGNCLESVSQSAASVQQCAAVKNKDKRMYLDGIYVSERTNVVKVDN
jgi:large subunit ribosomal protein L9e